MDPRFNGDILKHLEKKNELLKNAYDSMSQELHKLLVEEEMLMRKFYELMSAQGLTKRLGKEKKHKQSSVDKEVEDTANEISQIAEDSEKMSASMMTHNQRGLYKIIQLGKEKKAAKINKLKERKKKHESQASEKH